MNESVGFGGGWLSVLVILVVLFGMGGGGFGFGNNATAAMAGFTTQADLNQAIANQSVQNSLNSALLSSANNNYETAQLINQQSMNMLNQNNTNLLAAINGFNTTNNAIVAGFASVNQNIADLGYRMDKCCCEIKTQMLEQRLQDTQIALQNQQNISVNAQQSQYLLSQLGSFVPTVAAI